MGAPEQGSASVVGDTETRCTTQCEAARVLLAPAGAPRPSRKLTGKGRIRSRAGTVTASAGLLVVWLVGWRRAAVCGPPACVHRRFNRSCAWLRVRWLAVCQMRTDQCQLSAFRCGTYILSSQRLAPIRSSADDWGSPAQRRASEKGEDWATAAVSSTASRTMQQNAPGWQAAWACRRK